MYDQFYQFNAEPFRLSPDHAFAYAHKGYVKARAYMAYAFMRAEGFVMITGRPGTGKTTLVGALVDHLAGEDVSVANLVCTQLQADDLLKLVAYEFGVSVNVIQKGELLQRLTQQLKSWHRDGRRALLIVDEAQDLSVSAMEELRLLTNIQVDGKPLLQIFLLGQPELRELVLSPALEQVYQRIVAASHLRALEVDETEAYILHRLEVVGWRGDPTIRKSIYPLIHKYSEGVPRRINLICSRLLLQCAVEQRHTVGLDDLREVIRELQEENLAAGTGYSEADFRAAEEPIEESIDDTPDTAQQSSGFDSGGIGAESAPTSVTAGDTNTSGHDMPDPTIHARAGVESNVVSREGGNKRHHLTVIGGGASRMSALKTGTTNWELENLHQQAEPEAETWVEPALDQIEASAVSPIRAQSTPVEDEIVEPPMSTQAGDEGDYSSPVDAPVVESPADTDGDKGGIRGILIIMVVSIGLVAWAVTGFDVGVFLGK